MVNGETVKKQRGNETIGSDTRHMGNKEEVAAAARKDVLSEHVPHAIIVTTTTSVVGI